MLMFLYKKVKRGYCRDGKTFFSLLLLYHMNLIQYT